MDTATTPSLPPGFEDLLPWVSWARPSQRERYTHRIGTPLTKVTAFRDALLPRMDAAMTCRQSQPADTARVGEPARRLFHLVLAWFEASTPVRLHWPSSDLDDAFLAHRIVYVGPSLDADCADRRPVCRLLIAGRTRPGCATRTR